MSSGTPRITGYGVGAPKITLNPPPVISTRNPTTTDIRFPLGQDWVNKDAAACFQLASVSAGVATWVTTGGGAGAVATLTGNSGGAISPTGGNINIIGAGALAFSGSGSTLTGTITPGAALIATLTGNSGGARPPTAGNFNILGSNGVLVTGAGSTLTITTDVGGFPITPFVVGPVGQAGYQTVQAAITAANAAGGGAIYVQPGTYTENLTLFSNITIVGTDPLRSIITGVHTPPASGTVTFENLVLNSATSIFSSAAAGSTNITLVTCVCNVTSGYVFDLLNWTGTLFFYGCGATGTTDGGINNTGGATVVINNSTVGAGAGAMTASGGTVTIQGARLNCSATFGGAATVTALESYFSKAITFSGTATGSFYKGTFVTGAAAALTQSSTNAVTLTQGTIDSSANPVIAGAGAGGVRLGDVEFVTNYQISASFTTTYLRAVGRISPYSVGPTGNYNTVQAAVTAANDAGGGVVYVQPGTYTENLTLFSNVTVVGTDPLRSVITGVHTPPASGTVTFENIGLTSATSIFSSVAAGTTNITLVTCVCAVTSGYVFDLLNWTGILFFYGCGATGTTDGGVNNTGGSAVVINDSTVGAGAGAMTASGGAVNIQSSRLNCSATFGGAGTMNGVNSYFSKALTFSGSNIATLQGCTFSTGAAAAITQSSSGTISLTQSTVTSSNNPAIAGAGAGVLTIGDVSFPSNALLAGTLTVAYASISGALASVNSAGASPQIVNARTGQVIFTDTIANGAYGTLTLTNSVIAAGSKIIACVSCTTVNSACQIVEITPGAGSVAFRIFNAGSASTAANILVNFWVID